MDRDAVLLTPGPLTTTLRTKLAMLRDWGSWDVDFNEMTAELRTQLLRIEGFSGFVEKEFYGAPIARVGTEELDEIVRIRRFFQPLSRCCNPFIKACCRISARGFDCRGLSGS